jgi:hypothetical protein
MTCRCSPSSAFRWSEFPQPSIFVDGVFDKGARTGKTTSQISSESITRITRELGRSPMTMAGISARADNLIAQHAQRTGSEKAARERRSSAKEA